MAKFSIARSATPNLVVRVFLQDSAVTTGAGKTGIVRTQADLKINVIRALSAASTNYVGGTSVEDITTLGTYAAPTSANCRFKEIDATNLPGWYEIHLEQAAGGTADASRFVSGMVRATGVAPCPFEVALDAVDRQDAVRMGMTALPNAAADAAGGLPISDAGGLDLDAKLANTDEVTAVRMGALTDWIDAGRLDLILDIIAADTAAVKTKTDFLPSATAGAAGGVFIAGANAATSVTTALTANITGDLSGSVGSLAAQAKADVNAEVDAALDTAIPGTPTSDSINERVKTLDDNYTATRGGYLDKLNITGNVASSGEVTAIQNNTRVRVIVPPMIERPDSGSTAYKLHLYLYDQVGNMEAPDSTPTLTAVNEAGTDRSANLGAVTLEGTGHYSVTYTVSSAHVIEELLFEWSIVEGGATRLHGAAAQIVDTTAVDFTSADRTKLDTLHDTRIPGVIQPQTGDAFARLGAPVGASISADIAAVKADTAAVKTKTDNLPTDPADESLIIAATDAVMARLGAPAGASIAADIATRATPAQVNTECDTAIADARLNQLLAASMAAPAAGSLFAELTEDDAGTQRFTTNALEQAPSGGGSSETRNHEGTAQAGGAATITLDAGASAVNDFYKNQRCAIVGGTGAGECEIIASYVGATRVATMAASWATAPDATSQFRILPLGTIPGASAPTADQVGETVLDKLSTEKIVVDRSTGQITAYKADGTTARGTRELTEIDADKIGYVPV